MVRYIIRISVVIGASLIQYITVSAENLTPGLRLVRAHTREPWVTEIPVDMDLDGRDEILLISDHTKGGHETSFIQLHTIDDIFVAGPVLPEGEIQSVHTADLHGDGSQELVLLLRKPKQIIIADITGSGDKTIRSIDLYDDEGISVLSIEDLDGASPLDFVFVLSDSKNVNSFRIIGYNWYSDRILWDTELPGRFGHTVLMSRISSGHILLVPYRSTDTTGVYLINSTGKTIGHLMLSDNSAGDAHLSLIEQPFNESLVIASIPVRNPRGNETEITIWDISNLERIAKQCIHGVTEQVMACKAPGTSSVVIGTETGYLKFYNQNLEERNQYQISTQPVELKDVVDLDQDGVCEIIAVSEDSMFCFLPETDQSLSFPGRDECHIIRQGFGLRPLISVRDGRTYNYLRLDLIENYHLNGMAFSPFEIIGFVVAIIIAGTLIGVSIGYGFSIKRIKQLFTNSTAGYALVDMRKRIIWSNDSFRTLLSENHLPKSESNTGTQSTKVFYESPDGTLRSIHENLVKTGEFREWWGSRRFLVTRTDPSTEIEHILYEAWAHAMREITARMRDALSTIRLGTQWIFAHRVDSEKQSAHRERLKVLLRETRELQELTTLLSNAASLSEKDHEQVCLASLVRDSIAHLPFRVASRIHIHSDDSIPLINAGKRQLGFAIHYLLGTLISKEPDTTEIDVRIIRETDAQTGDAVTITIRCYHETEMRVPVYVEALVRAVVLSCGGEMEVQTTREEDLIIELRFTAGDSR